MDACIPPRQVPLMGADAQHAGPPCWHVALLQAMLDGTGCDRECSHCTVEARWLLTSRLQSYSLTKGHTLVLLQMKRSTVVGANNAGVVDDIRTSAGTFLM